jgi:succinyl-CoA synthetase alpha subunit
VITQGITGKTGQFHAGCAASTETDTIALSRASIRKGRRGLRGHPDLRDGEEARDATGATVSVIYVPPPFAAAAIDEAVDAGLDLVVCITEEFRCAT